MLPVVREVRLPGINLMTLLIKVAGGRELVMVHLGRRTSFPSDPGDRYPTGSTPSRFDRSAGSAGRMQLLTDRVCIELLMPGLPAFRPSFRIWRCLLAVLMGRDARWTRLATFRTVRVPVRC